MARRRRRSYREFIEADLDIMPLMNLFVVLIPMLLLSAVFVELSVLDMKLPSKDDNAEDDDKNVLSLSVTIEKERYVIAGRKLRASSIDRNQEGADDRLFTALAEIREGQSAQPGLTIVSPADARYQDIITVMDIGQEAGLGAVSLAGASTH
jgi:biopolymer transport protein ExbD